MTLNDTPNAQRVHIGIFGRRNSGKSSLVNALCGQNVSIVSDVLGTTTDPVSKAMELLPLGAVVFFDTPGLDDEGELGTERIRRSRDVLRKCDIAIIVCDASAGMGEIENELEHECKKRGIPSITVLNKCDINKSDGLCVSAKTGEGIEALKKRIAAIQIGQARALLDGIIKCGDNVILVTPIDSSAPKGRLILPQQQAIREILDCGATAIVVQENALPGALKMCTPSIVITDSQVFESVAEEVPANVKLTSFSILFARKRGILGASMEGAKALDKLADGDIILISEGCTHHRQCEDIGTVKLPAWIRRRCGKNISFEYTSGAQFPEALNKYRLIIHCGGCMLNLREMHFRFSSAAAQNVPITNYGVAIAHLKGIAERALQAL
ncbi:MAG: [FeFe] hydrogenase H-cluster maturation GTPase HydF [Clostridia bacterium]|nr:[FeFe] hydrogenase H-cluster maturation GTPase HydF [Clostridia bacterium]